MEVLKITEEEAALFRRIKTLLPDPSIAGGAKQQLWGAIKHRLGLAHEDKYAVTTDPKSDRYRVIRPKGADAGLMHAVSGMPYLSCNIEEAIPHLQIAFSDSSEHVPGEASRLFGALWYHDGKLYFPKA